MTCTPFWFPMRDAAKNKPMEPTKSEVPSKGRYTIHATAATVVAVQLPKTRFATVTPKLIIEFAMGPNNGIQFNVISAVVVIIEVIEG